MIGTSTRPDPDTPNSAVSKRAEFWLTIATRSPVPMPSASSPAAIARRPRGHFAIRDRAPRRRGLVGFVDDGRAIGIDEFGAAEEVVDGERNLHGREPIRRRVHAVT